MFIAAQKEVSPKLRRSDIYSAPLELREPRSRASINIALLRSAWTHLHHHLYGDGRERELDPDNGNRARAAFAVGDRGGTPSSPLHSL